MYEEYEKVDLKAEIAEKFTNPLLVAKMMKKVIMIIKIIIILVRLTSIMKI